MYVEGGEAKRYRHITWPDVDYLGYSYRRESLKSPLTNPVIDMAETYVAHRIIRRLAHWGVWAFFTRFQVINGENMPDGGPVILWVSS